MRGDQRRGQSGRHATTIGVAIVLAVSGCATGERPSLIDEPEVDDPVAEAVLDRLGRADTATFTATYEITPSLTGEPTPATVIQSGLRRRITIGDVTFFTDGTLSRTCMAGGVNCVESIDDAWISNLSITHEFWSHSTATKLQNDSARSVAGSNGRTDNIAGRSATCADIQVPSNDGVGTVTYCAIDDGVLARYFGADVSIELTSFDTVADEAALDA